MTRKKSEEIQDDDDNKVASIAAQASDAVGKAGEVASSMFSKLAGFFSGQSNEKKTASDGDKTNLLEKANALPPTNSSVEAETKTMPLDATPLALIRSPEIHSASASTSDETGEAGISTVSTHDQADKAKISAVSTLDQADKAKISASDQPDGGAQKSGRLPEIPSLLNKPSKVLLELSKQISSLKEHLAEAEAHNHHEVAHRKTEYEAVLEQQRMNSTSMEKANRKVKSEIEELMLSNANMRKRAAQLGKQGSMLRQKLATLQSNLSIAQEYLVTTLRADPNDKVKLSVLRELDEQDELLSKSSDHEARLKKVGGMALLQEVSAPTDSDPFYVVQVLGSKFDELEREQKASMAALKENFEKDFGTEDLKQSKLKQEHKALLATKDGQ